MTENIKSTEQSTNVSTADKAWRLAAMALSPIAGFFKARAWWQYVIMAAIFFGFAAFRVELKAIALTCLLTLPVILSGYVNRKLANPELSVDELMGARDEKTGKRLEPVPASHAELIKTLLWVQCAYTVMAFCGVIYILPSILEKLK